MSHEQGSKASKQFFEKISLVVLEELGIRNLFSVSHEVNLESFNRTSQGGFDYSDAATSEKLGHNLMFLDDLWQMFLVEAWEPHHEGIPVGVLQKTPEHVWESTSIEPFETLILVNVSDYL